MELADGDSLVISGDYQRYFEYGGVRYAHLIDLTTGWPARYVSSVAVLAHADTGGLADALSTGLFCLPDLLARPLLPRTTTPSSGCTPTKPPKKATTGRNKTRATDLFKPVALMIS